MAVKNYLACVLSFLAMGCENKGMAMHSEDDELKVVDTMICIPDSVRSIDVIEIRLPGDNGGDMAIINPSGTYFFLSNSRNGEAGVNAYELDSNQLNNTTSISLDVDRLMAVPYVYGKTNMDRVFEDSGVYTLRVGENLETDAGAMTMECEVFYSADYRN